MEEVWPFPIWSSCVSSGSIPHVLQDSRQRSQPFSDQFTIIAKGLIEEANVFIDFLIIGAYRNCHGIALQSNPIDNWIVWVVELLKAISVLEVAESSADENGKVQCSVQGHFLRLS